MARTETVIDIFIASPGELTPERQEIVNFLQEYNLTHGLNSGFRLNPLMWESNTHPAFGDDPQSLINEQLGNSYDIFIGMLWRTFGTPTPRAASGTKEEFDRAHSKHLAGEDVEILFYFKMDSGDLSELDPTQYQKVVEFKKSIQKKSLYQEFKQLDEFANLIRLHLPRVIKKVVDKINSDESQKKTAVSLNTTPQPNQKESYEQQLGYFEHMQKMEEMFVELSTHMQLLTNVVNEFNVNINQRTKEVQDATEADEDVGVRKALMDRSADDMIELAITMENVSPKLYSSIRDGFYHASQAIAIQVSDFPNEAEDMSETIEAVDELQTHLNQTRKNIASFKREIDKLPRLTKKISEAKTKLSNSLSEIVEGIKLGERLSSQVSDELRSV